MFNVRAVKIENVSEAKRLLTEIGVDNGGLAWMMPKAVHRIIKVNKVPLKAAIILKQEMLSKGGEAAVSRGVGGLAVDFTDVVLCGTTAQYIQLIEKLKTQPFGLAKLALDLDRALKNIENTYVPKEINCRGRILPLGQRTLVMGILNVTPDSFSDGGKFNHLDGALKRAHEMVKMGADIIDIGGESTKPNYEYVPVEEEIDRILPVLEKLVNEVECPISIDTYKADVARATLNAGAHIINDIWGLKADSNMAGVVAEYDVPVILMHNQNGTSYNSLMDEVLATLQDSVNLAIEAGVKKENIILDPGIGFGKDLDQNLEVMHRLWELKTLGYPVLLGTSRKSMIGKTLDLPVEDRVEGTAATVAYGITQGIDIIRVHDVKEMTRVVKMMDAMVRR